MKIFLLWELVCTYDKLNIYAKKIRVMGALTIFYFNFQSFREEKKKSRNEEIVQL